MSRTGTKGAARVALCAALVVVFATALVGTASATTTNVPIWESGGTHLAYGKEVPLKGEPLAGLTVEWNSATSVRALACQGMKTGGYAENYAAETPGQLKNNGAGTGFTFAECQYNPGENQICKLSQEPKFTFTSAKLSDAENAKGALVVTNGVISINTKGCVEAGTFSVPFSATLMPGELAGEFRLAKNLKVTVNGQEGELRQFGIRVVSEGQPVVVGQESVRSGAPYGHRWYRGGGGKRGEGPKTLIAAGTPAYLGLGSTSMTLAGYQSGVLVNIACNGHGFVGGSVENPAGGGAGTGSVGLSETGCVVQKPAGKECVVTNEGFTTKPLSLTVTNPSDETSLPVLSLKPTTGELIASFSLTGCSLKVLNHEYMFTGALVASATGDREHPFAIPTNQNETLARISGQKVTVGGSITPETASGEIISMG